MSTVPVYEDEKEIPTLVLEHALRVYVDTVYNYLGHFFIEREVKSITS